MGSNIGVPFFLHDSEFLSVPMLESQSEPFYVALMEEQISRLNQQLKFILEIDKLKKILRQNIITDKSRNENSAEHSWHLAIMAIFLTEHSPDPLDIHKVVKMVLIHDLVEIDAGDLFCYNDEELRSQKEREFTAANRIFGLLPADQSQELWDIWTEFESGQTAEARFARALDRLQPVMLHEGTDHFGWRKNKVTEKQILSRMLAIKEDVPAFWPRIVQNIEAAKLSGAIIS